MLNKYAKSQYEVTKMIQMQTTKRLGLTLAEKNGLDDYIGLCW